MSSNGLTGWKVFNTVWGEQHVLYNKDGYAEIAIFKRDGKIWFPHANAPVELVPEGLTDEEVRQYAETLLRMS